MKIYRYPLKISEKRTIPPDYSGDIYIWDVDKTYLSTNFESVRGLLRIPFEKGADKVAISGTTALLKELSRGPEEVSQLNPILFITATPPQLAKAIEEKLELDDIPYWGITYKDNLANIRKGKFSKVREQVSYKLSALLLNRARFGLSSTEVLFGDDSESDALIYSLYSDIVSGRLGGDRLHAVFETLNIYPEDREYIVRIKGDLPDHDPVKRIYINLSKNTPPREFDHYGTFIVPSLDSFQTAVHLWCSGKISLDGVLRVTEELLDIYGYTAPRILFSFSEAFSRHILEPRAARIVSDHLVSHGIIPPEFSYHETLRARFIGRWRRLRGGFVRRRLPSSEPDIVQGRLRTPSVVLEQLDRIGKKTQ